VHLDNNPMLSKLRAGMSAIVEIDTGKRPSRFSSAEVKTADKK
jgi:hypothetical protein